MDLFRAKKRDQNFASLEEVSDTLQKKHRGLSGSLGDLLDAGQDELPDTATESSSSESESETANKASKKQKIFAKRSIKWEKKKEKEQRKKAEKNMISMDDFLRKQSEFKMWLYEEKSKNASSLTSPKLKTHFKQFVRLWNKRKLQPKYYRCSTLPDSPATPLTSSRRNFLHDHSGAPLAVEESEDAEKEATKSPLVTFGKTPPKLLRSKKFRLFSTQEEVALISVAPLGSPQVVYTNNKENIDKKEECQYRVPHVQKVATNEQKSDDGSSKASTVGGAIPYKVSVFPWAVDNKVDRDQSLEICVTSTPPGGTQDSNWPPPPTPSEITGTLRDTESPHKPPPPPPRIGSLKKSHGNVTSRVIVGSYADPYDNVYVETADEKKTQSDYQEPVDTLQTVNHRTIPDDARLVLESLISDYQEPTITAQAVNHGTILGNPRLVLGSYGDEPEMSMYHKPISEGRCSKEELEQMYAKPMKRLKSETACNILNTEIDDDRNVASEAVGDCGSRKGGIGHSELFSEIMGELSKNKGLSKIARKEPDYASIDDCVGGGEDKRKVANKEYDTVISKANTDVNMTNFNSSELTKVKKKIVMAASSEKIYETYLSMGANAGLFKNKWGMMKPSQNSAPLSNLEKKFKSQPDILSSDDTDMLMDGKSNPVCSRKPLMSTFKPAAMSAYDVPCSEFLPHKSTTHISKSHIGRSFDNISDQLGTPIIMATPSFESLYPPHRTGNQSGSSQSLTGRSGSSSESLTGRSGSSSESLTGRSGSSSESLSTHHSAMSTTTTSSLSFGPDEESGSMQSLQSDKSGIEVGDNRKMEVSALVPGKGSIDERNADLFMKGLLPMTPGKLNAAKHGIDLSVYLLKPAKPAEPAASIKEPSCNEDEMQPSKIQDLKRDLQACIGKEVHDANSKIVIKETLSGMKTKVDMSKNPVKKEAERRHTVQTVHEFQKGASHQNNPSQVPKIGIAGKARKHEAASQSGKSGQSGRSSQRKPMSGDGGKVGVGGGERATRVVVEGKERYLETDLDMLVQQKPRPPLQKSKSHSGFEFGSDNVVTDIW